MGGNATDVASGTDFKLRQGLVARMDVPLREVELVLHQFGYCTPPGIPHHIQLASYLNKFDPKTEPSNEAEYRQREDSLKCAIDGNRIILEEVRSASNLIELQRPVVILNVNEFLLREKPPKELFKRLVLDFYDHQTVWGSKRLPDLTLTLTSSSRQICDLALARFDSLSTG